MLNEFFNPTKEKNTIYNVPKQIGEAASSIFANIFKNVDAPSPIVTSPDNLPRRGNPFYQVTADDTGMDSVATNTGVALPDLVTANNGMRTLPPVGSYIATSQPTQSPDMFQAQARGYVPMNNTPITQPSDMYGTRREAKGNPISAAMQQRDVVNTSFGAFNEAYRLTGQVDTSLLPTSINIATVKALEAKGFFASGVDAEGNPLTPAEALQQYGYQFKDGQFVQTGAVGGQKNDKPALGTVEGQVMDNKFVLIRKGNKLVWQNQNKRNAVPDVKRKKAPAANAATTPQTTLGLNVGSG